MNSLEPKTLVKKLKLTLEMNSVDFEKVIIDLGQVDAVNRRAEGYTFQY
jgi:hypothetical protein